MAAAAWLAVVSGVVIGAAAAAWPDDLGEAGSVRTGLNYAAFMGATFAFHAGAAMAGVAAAAIRAW